MHNILFSPTRFKQCERRWFLCEGWTNSTDNAIHKTLAHCLTILHLKWFASVQAMYKYTFCDSQENNSLLYFTTISWRLNNYPKYRTPFFLFLKNSKSTQTLTDWQNPSKYMKDMRSGSQIKGEKREEVRNLFTCSPQYFVCLAIHI